MEIIQKLYKDSPTKAKTRERIIQSAISLFSEKGMEAVLMKEIASGCDITTRNLYRYYPNKEMLVIDAAYVMFESFTSAITPENNGETIPIQIKNHLQKYIKVEKSDKGGIKFTRFIMYFDLYINKMSKENPAYIRYVEEYRDKINGDGYTALTSLLVQGINDGSLGIELEEVDFYVVYIIQSLTSIMMRAIVKESENPTINDTLVDKQIDVIISYISN